MPVSELPWAHFDTASGILTLRVHVQPGAKQTQVAGIHGDRLKIRLSAPPVEGRANAALREFVAAAFAVPQRSVELASGESGRKKTLRISGPRLRPDLEWAHSSATEA